MANIDDKQQTQKICSDCRHPDRDHCHIEKIDSSGILPVSGSCKMEDCTCEMLMPEKKRKEESESKRV
jgi:hypothetical protein